MENEFEEKVRLLLLDATDDRRRSWVDKFPPYIVTTFWWGFFFTSVTALFMLVIFLTVTRYEEQTIYKHPIFLTHLEPLSYVQSNPRKKENVLSKLLESSNNVFFPLNKPLDWRSSCSLESILSHSHDKNVFYMAFHGTTDGIFEKKLRAEYSNLMMLKVDGEQYFTGSMFQGEWKDDEKSLRKVQLLTIWQFGGTVVSPDVIVTSKFPSSENLNCLVSEDLITCPIQCSAFVYQLILTGRTNGCKDVVRKAVEEFCRNPVTCPGVQKLQPTCSQPGDGCFLVRLPQEPLPSNQTWNSVAHFCPVTYITSKFP